MKKYITRPVNPTKIPVRDEIPLPVSIKVWANSCLKSDEEEVLYVNDEPQKFIRTEHGFFKAIKMAYMSHLDLVLEPQMVWLTIIQAFSTHIELNSEKLRSKFVTFEGKKDLTIEVKGFQNSKAQYEEVFERITKLISKEITPETYELMNPKFSSTSKLYQNLFNLQTMNSLKSYFSYGMRITCGIRNVKMGGTEEDWKIIIAKTTEMLTKFDFEWWGPYIFPVLQEFLMTYKAQTNKIFWDCSYKAIPINSGSYKRNSYHYGSSFVGWIINFFPYIKGTEYKGEMKHEIMIKSDKMKTLSELYILHDKIGSQDNLEEHSDKTKKEVSDFVGHSRLFNEDLPSGYKSTDFTINNNGHLLSTIIDAGFVGVHFDKENFEVYPVASWMIRQRKQKQEKKKKSDCEIN